MPTKKGKSKAGKAKKASSKMRKSPRKGAAARTAKRKTGRATAGGARRGKATSRKRAGTTKPTAPSMPMPGQGADLKATTGGIGQDSGRMTIL
jgi:hypothetical protein